MQSLLKLNVLVSVDWPIPKKNHQNKLFWVYQPHITGTLNLSDLHSCTIVPCTVHCIVPLFQLSRTSHYLPTNFSGPTALFLGGKAILESVPAAEPIMICEISGVLSILFFLSLWPAEWIRFVWYPQLLQINQIRQITTKLNPRWILSLPTPFSWSDEHKK